MNKGNHQFKRADKVLNHNTKQMLGLSIVLVISFIISNYLAITLSDFIKTTTYSIVRNLVYQYVVTILPLLILIAYFYLKISFNNFGLIINKLWLEINKALTFIKNNLVTFIFFLIISGSFILFGSGFFLKIPVINLLLLLPNNLLLFPILVNVVFVFAIPNILTYLFNQKNKGFVEFGLNILVGLMFCDLYFNFIPPVLSHLIVGTGYFISYLGMRYLFKHSNNLLVSIIYFMVLSFFTMFLA